jgi:Na+/phosphate symporter
MPTMVEVRAVFADTRSVLEDVTATDLDDETSSAVEALRVEIDAFIAQPPQRELADSDLERLREKIDRVRELTGSGSLIEGRPHPG